MFQFVGQVSLPNNSPKTYAELIRTAIEARVYPTTAAKQAHKDRFYPCVASEGFISNQSAATVYEADAFKGATNGVADAAAFTLPGDLTSGYPIESGDAKHYLPKVDLGSRLLYQNSGATINLYIDVIIQ